MRIDDIYSSIESFWDLFPEGSNIYDMGIIPMDLYLEMRDIPKNLKDVFDEAVHKSMLEVKGGADSDNFSDFVIINFITIAARMGYSTENIRKFVADLSKDNDEVVLIDFDADPDPFSPVVSEEEFFGEDSMVEVVDEFTTGDFLRKDYSGSDVSLPGVDDVSEKVDSLNKSSVNSVDSSVNVNNFCSSDTVDEVSEVSKVDNVSEVDDVAEDSELLKEKFLNLLKNASGG